MLTRLKKQGLSEGRPTFRLEDDGVLLWKSENLLAGEVNSVGHFSLTVMNPSGIRDVLCLKSPKMVAVGHAGASVAAVFDNVVTGEYRGTDVNVWHLPKYSANVDQAALKEREPVGVLHLDSQVVAIALDHHGQRLAVITRGCLYVYSVDKDMECIAADDKVGINAKSVYFLSHDAVVVYDCVAKKTQHYDIQK